VSLIGQPGIQQMTESLVGFVSICLRDLLFLYKHSNFFITEYSVYHPFNFVVYERKSQVEELLVVVIIILCWVVLSFVILRCVLFINQLELQSKAIVILRKFYIEFDVDCSSRHLLDWW
jgi:hypothetical protein